MYRKTGCYKTFPLSGFSIRSDFWSAANQFPGSLGERWNKVSFFVKLCPFSTPKPSSPPICDIWDLRRSVRGPRHAILEEGEEELCVFKWGRHEWIKWCQAKRKGQLQGQIGTQTVSGKLGVIFTIIYSCPRACPWQKWNLHFWLIHACVEGHWGHWDCWELRTRHCTMHTYFMMLFAFHCPNCIFCNLVHTICA